MITDRVLRTVPLAVPALFLLYAVARFIDGRDGDHGPSASWNVGHLAFFGAFLGLGLLTVALRRNLRRGTDPWLDAVGGASLVGVALVCWVILTDLIPSLDARASLPDPVMAVGPAVFIVGFVGLLVIAARRSSAVTPVTPGLGLLAFGLVGADLDLLAVTAGLLLVALWPVRRLAPARPPLRRWRPALVSAPPVVDDGQDLGQSVHHCVRLDLDRDLLGRRDVAVRDQHGPHTDRAGA